MKVGHQRENVFTRARPVNKSSMRKTFSEETKSLAIVPEDSELVATFVDKDKVTVLQGIAIQKS